MASFGQKYLVALLKGAREHVPWLTVDRHDYATVIVGDGQGSIHPMIASYNPKEVHWITHIFVLLLSRYIGIPIFIVAMTLRRR